jgi:hypothetical protein
MITRSREGASQSSGWPLSGILGYGRPSQQPIDFTTMCSAPRLSVAAILLLTSSPSSADAGVPMLALAWPAQWLGLIPIVMIESEIIRRALGISFRQVLMPVVKANLLSTFVGVPLAWFAMLCLEFVVGSGFSLVSKNMEVPKYVYYALFPFMAAWVGGNWWQVLIAFEILLVPFCFVSIFFEERVLRRAFPDHPASTIHAFTRRANVFSYGLLGLLAPIYPLLRSAG